MPVYESGYELDTYLITNLDIILHIRAVYNMYLETNTFIRLDDDFDKPLDSWIGL
jgi:hypothetical protein